MREIKFRVWNIEDKSWAQGYSSTDEIFFTNESEGEGVIPCQYTGLKDKNGVEIYEGDVLTFEDQKTRYVVEWDKNTASFQIGWSCAVFDQECDIDYNEFEVIGNICENPELL